MITYFLVFRSAFLVVHMTSLEHVRSRQWIKDEGYLINSYYYLRALGWERISIGTLWTRQSHGWNDSADGIAVPKKRESAMNRWKGNGLTVPAGHASTKGVPANQRGNGRKTGVDGKTYSADQRK
jgi:hypothetical protein